MALLDSLHVDEPIAKDTAFNSFKGRGGLCYSKQYLTDTFCHSRTTVSCPHWEGGLSQNLCAQDC